MTNMNTRQTIQAPRKVARMLRILGQPTRLRILLALAEDEACVCHLETQMGLRQAYLSQHLMALRKAGLVNDRREGRFIYYRLRDTRVLEVIEQATALSGIPAEAMKAAPRPGPLADCSCPRCNPEIENAGQILQIGLPAPEN